MLDGPVGVIHEMASGTRTAGGIVACGIAIALGDLGRSFSGNGHHLRYSPDAIALGAVMFGAVIGGIVRRNRGHT